MEEIKVNNRIWIEKEGKPFLGNGRIALLESIGQQGSINKAAKSLGMSYKRAWQLINAINSLSDEPIVIRTTGGFGGGGTKLTEKGKKVVVEFRRMDKMCRNLLSREMKTDCF
ncbi:MAG: LysR family transcriptional regulator [Bacteroidales bacterium]|jgi:molybdate transport system regulatory protein